MTLAAAIGYAIGIFIFAIIIRIYRRKMMDRAVENSRSGNLKSREVDQHD